MDNFVEISSDDHLNGDLDSVRDLLFGKRPSELPNRLESTPPPVTETSLDLEGRIESLEDQVNCLETKLLAEIDTQGQKTDANLSELREEVIQRIATLSKLTDDRAELGDFLIDLGLKIQPEQLAVRN